MIQEEVIFTKETQTAIFFVVKDSFKIFRKTIERTRSAYIEKVSDGFKSHFYWAKNGKLCFESRLIDKLIDSYEASKEEQSNI